jgi:uncharacterized membrane protein YgaE (UPF0421/DUF939 family)
MEILPLIWGCIPELTNDCLDMTNASSTYLSVLVGAVIGGVISWLVFTRQQKTAKIQDVALQRIEELNKRHDKILKTIEAIEEHNKKTLNSVLNLEKRIAGQSNK